MADITNLFPSLETFVASSNAFSALTPHFLPATITDLTLEDNELTSLSNLHPLTHLPNLRRLILKNNKIFEISTSDTNSLVFSSSLTELDLSYNEISTWSFIDQLETVFPGLTALRIPHNPLYQNLRSPDGKALSPQDGYMLTFARLGKLKNINYSPISDKDRLNAEPYYLSLIARELASAPEDLAAEIVAQHPRYKYLCEEYGDPVVRRETSAVNPVSLAARLIKFKLRLGDSVKHAAASTAGASDIEVEVPVGFTSYSLHGVVGKELGLKPLKLKLIWETGDWMPASHQFDINKEESWDSESSDDEIKESTQRTEMVMREVEIVPGTRLVGTWVDGMEAVVRVELKL